jgi:hypothetical protein
MSRKIRTKFLAEDDFDLWSDMVGRAAAGSIYSLPAYLDVLCAAVGGHYRILGAFKGDELLGGIALYECRRGLVRVVSNRLLLYYNGLVIKDRPSKYPSEITSLQLAVLDALEEALSKSGLAHIRIHSRHPIADLRVFLARGWRANPAYSYVVDFRDLGLTWSRIAHNLRRLIRRCESHDFSFVADNDFESFYRLHVQTHERKGSPIYLRKGDFKRYFEKLRAANLCRLYHLKLPGDRAVASQLVLLGEHPVSHTVAAAADSEFLQSGVNPNLRWHVFQALAKLGYSANDLTDATLNEVSRFKSQLGGALVTNLVLVKERAFLYRTSLLVDRIVNSAGKVWRKLGPPSLKTRRDNEAA